MSAPSVIVAMRAARWRTVAIALAALLPLATAIVWLAARHAGSAAALLSALCGAMVFAALVMQRRWRLDTGALLRRLDARRRDLDDSAGLLLRDPATLTPLARLQRIRLQERLAHDPRIDLREDWPRRTIALGALLALAVLGLAARAPMPMSASGTGKATADEAADGLALRAVSLHVTPPAYTGLAATDVDGPETKAAQGSRLDWRIVLAPVPSSVDLAFHDGSRLALRRDGDAFVGSRTLDASTLYRIEPDWIGPDPIGTERHARPAQGRLYRLDAIADAAPEVRVLEPEHTLNLLADGQTEWPLAFEASDDYGLGRAELQLTLAQGGGENVHFQERRIELAGEGDARHRRYRHRLDLAALGIARGDDVVVRVAVSDNREPEPNTTRSASFILRWPAEASTDGSAIDGIVQKTLPAYFRSQRQIIIDTEALIAERESLAEATFVDRSDRIGVDQKILRLRYGQFLGEESEAGGAHAHADDAEQGHDHDSDHDHDHEDEHGDANHEHADEHDHDHGHDAPFAGTASGGFGNAGNVLAEYGHTHDHAEAATLLDPQTRALLKTALAEMWQAELHLRTGAPQDALPYEYRALDAVKQVQQASRIYLARVGLELPRVDETRRLSGDRAGLSDRSGTLAPAIADAQPMQRLWHALDGADAPDWDAAEAWLRAHGNDVPEALGVIAAIDRARRDPRCAECRDALRAPLWSLLPTPAAAATPRAMPDATGRAYLDALRKGAEAKR